MASVCGLMCCLCCRNLAICWTRLTQETMAILVRACSCPNSSLSLSLRPLASLSPGVYFMDPEITPAGQGCHRWDGSNTTVKAFPLEVEVRAIVEGQFMAKWIHAHKLGYKITLSSKILATGGASNNTAILQASIAGCSGCVLIHIYTYIIILQIIADIFNSDVYVLEGTANSASLGGAYRAKHG